MKHENIAGKILATVALSAITYCANAQSFLPATVQEDVYPALTSDVPSNSSNASAYSYGNLMINSVLSDLYVYTWDGGESLSGAAGFAVRQYPANTAVSYGVVPINEAYNPANFPIDDAASVQAVILKSGSDIYIALTYYWISQKGFYYDLYKYDPSAPNLLTQVPSFPKDLSNGTFFGGSIQFSWIRIDAINLQEYAIVYDIYGKPFIHASNNPMNPNFPVYIGPNPIIGNLPTSFDLALSQINYAPFNDTTKVFVTYLDLNQKRLNVVDMNFSDLVQTSPPTSTYFSTIPNSNFSKHSDYWGNPKIDAPDNSTASNMSWSVVAKDHNFSNQQEIIYAGVSVSGSVTDYNLNDGSLGSLMDISDASSGGQNSNPVVAYDLNPNNINFSWYYNNPNNPPSPYSDHAYIGFKMKNNGSIWGSGDYWLAPFAPDSTSNLPSIALSKQNDSGPGLFMAFTQYDYPNGYSYMGMKTVDWSNVGFKPEGASTITNVANDISMGVYPNPFHGSFSIAITGSKSQSFNVRVYDLMGREAIRLSGGIDEINKALSKKTLNLTPGSYFVSVCDQNNHEIGTHQVVKAK